MTPTSPPSSSSTSTSTTRPPTRNKSSSSLSTHTLRSLSSTTSTGTGTSSGKPRRNKSLVSLHHGHGAGHHNVQFTAHHHHPTRKGSHGASGSTAMKRRGSSQSQGGGGTTGGGGNTSGFGLGMTSMTRSDSHGSASNGEHAVEEEGGEREVSTSKVRPDLGERRTSSSSSTTTVVGGGGRSRSRGTAKRRDSGDVRGRGETSKGDSRSRSRANSRNQRQEEEDKKEEPSTSVTSTGDWASETDSPLNIGKKLPDVEVQKEFKPEGSSGLSMQLEVDQQQRQNEKKRNTTPSRLRKSKFQFAEDEDDEEEEGNEARPSSPPPEIPAAAMPPAETPALPALPAMLQQITPVRSPEPDETRAPPSPPPEQVGESAALQAPAAPSAPQGISPPDQEEFGQPPPVAGPELSRSPSPMTGQSLRKEESSRPGMEEPSLAQANVDEPNMAVREDKRHQQKHQGLKSLPRPSPRGHDSPSHSNKVTPEEGRSPAGPNPTELQEQRAKEGPSKEVEPQPSHPASNQLERPARRHPTRKSSNASVLSMASARSAAPSLISRMAPPAHFRRSASGIAPMVSRDSLIRGEMATPSPEPIAEDGSTSSRPDPTKSRKNGGRSATFSHERTSIQNSNRSVRSPSVTETPSRRSNTYAAGEVRKPRMSDGSNSGGGGGALAALGQIHQAAIVRTPSIASPGEGGGPRTPGALTHAKRSASGYFSSALRGLTSLPSALTPPLSPSAGSSSYTGIGGSSGAGGGAGGKHPIPGSSGMQTGGTGLGSSYSRSGGRSRSSPSPQQPPLIVKFLEQPSLPLAQPPSDSNPSTSPRQAHQPNRPQSLSQAHRNASSASLAMSRTQQKALLARDAPYYPTSSGPSSSGPSTSTQGLPPSNGLAPPPSPAPPSQSHPYLPSSSQPSSTTSGTSNSNPSNGMQRWAFGLIKEAERIERQWRCIEKWRDPVGESLERVLFRSSRAMERGGGSAGGSAGSASGRDSGNEQIGGKLVRIQKGRCEFEITLLLLRQLRDLY
ncbi:hypothetical protein JCM5353_008973 [Sporobolomyces roseus]